MPLFTKRFIKTLTASVTLFLAAQTAWADSLNDIYQAALQNDPVLRAARADFNAERESKNIRRAALLPQLTISGEYTEAEQNEYSLSSPYFGLIESETTEYKATLSQAIFDMPAWYNFKGAKALSQSARAQFAADQQDLIVRVSQAYFSVLHAYEKLQTRDAEELAIQRQLEQTRERFEVGLLPVTDVHEAQAAFDNAAVNSLEARGALNIAFEGLAVLTGKDHQVLAGLKDNFAASAPIPETTADWVNLALANNFQLKVVELEKDVAYNQAKAAVAARLPKISGSAIYYDSDKEGIDNFDDPLESIEDGHLYKISISMPIWGGGVDAKRRQAKQRSIQSAETYTAAKRNTVQSARSKHQLVITNAARVKARRQAITSADSALSATQAGYEVGTRNIVDVLVAQRTLYQAKRDYAKARYDYIISMMELKEAAGQLSPEDVASLNAWLDPKLVIAK